MTPASRNALAARDASQAAGVPQRWRGGFGRPTSRQDARPDARCEGARCETAPSHIRFLYGRQAGWRPPCFLLVSMTWSDPSAPCVSVVVASGRASSWGPHGGRELRFSLNGPHLPLRGREASPACSGGRCAHAGTKGAALIHGGTRFRRVHDGPVGVRLPRRACPRWEDPLTHTMRRRPSSP